MLALLNDQPILVLMATVALGAAVGTIPLGKIRLGASGALFVGLLVGAVLPDVGDRLALFQSFGLALFAYLIGLGAGKVFFRLSLIHISEPTRREWLSRMPSSA